MKFKKQSTSRNVKNLSSSQASRALLENSTETFNSNSTVSINVSEIQPINNNDNSNNDNDNNSDIEHDSSLNGNYIFLILYKITQYYIA